MEIGRREKGERESQRREREARRQERKTEEEEEKEETSQNTLRINKLLMFGSFRSMPSKGSKQKEFEKFIHQESLVETTISISTKSISQPKNRNKILKHLYTSLHIFIPCQ